MDVIGEIIFKFESLDTGRVIEKFSKGIMESKSMPPILIKFPSANLIENLPSLSEIAWLSLKSRTKLSFWSINTSAPEIYPSTTTPFKSL